MTTTHTPTPNTQTHNVTDSNTVTGHTTTDPAATKDSVTSGTAPQTAQTESDTTPAGSAHTDDSTTGNSSAEENHPEPITNPRQLLRIGHVCNKLLDELKGTELDPAGRKRLATIHLETVATLHKIIDAELSAELTALNPQLSSRSTPSQAELLVAQACLVGWLDGVAQSLPHIFMTKKTVALDPATAHTLLLGGPADPPTTATDSTVVTGQHTSSGNYL